MSSTAKRNRRLTKRIADYCSEIETLTAECGGSFEGFLSNIAIQRAIGMDILQIGELVGHLSQEVRNSIDPSLPWQKIRAMRNWLVHAYADADSDIIWETANEDIPKLRTLCLEALVKMDDKSDGVKKSEDLTD